MFQQFEQVQKLSKNNVDATLKTLGVVSQGTQSAALEVADYAKKAFEQGSAAFEKLAGVRSLDKVFEIQADFVKTSYEDFVAQATKLGQLYANAAKEAFAPFQGAVAQTAKK